MNRNVAIVILMTSNRLGGQLSEAEIRQRAQCLMALGVTREELGSAKKRVAQGEIDDLRNRAAAREAALTSIVDWTPDIPDAPAPPIDPAAPTDPAVSPFR